MGKKKNKLAQVIADSGMSTYELARQMNVHRTIISRHINGHVTNMRLDTLRKYSLALGVKISDLIDEKD